MRAKYRSALPQMSGNLFLTDGGIETTLIFHNGLDLPHFAAFDLLRTAAGRAALADYYRPYLEAAVRAKTGFVLESATWRASADWGNKLGYSREDLLTANREAITLLFALRGEYETVTTPCVMSGNIGPRGDGYNPSEIMDAESAKNYHATQVLAFEDCGVDLVTAITMTNTNEAVGVVLAAKDAGLPIVISFTTETDGRLPTGETLGDAIQTVDRATDKAPIYYMVNCAHPTHFESVLRTRDPWIERIRGVRANASKMSHAELDNAEELDDGDPEEFGADHKRLQSLLPALNVFGGCCGTDHRHISAICHSCR
jgi:S-methylmethionine-dependent homocysteine/selenocysteine methylase